MWYYIVVLYPHILKTKPKKGEKSQGKIRFYWGDVFDLVGPILLRFESTLYNKETKVINTEVLINKVSSFKFTLYYWGHHVYLMFI